MMRHFRACLGMAAIAAMSPCSAARAQGARAWAPSDAPRFLRMGADSTQPAAVIDPSGVPLLMRRVALHLNAMTRRSALKEIARVSGIQFVYADDAVAANDTVRLQADDITVTAALTDVLLGAGVDVALGADGNAILVTRGVLVPQAPKRDVIRGRVIAAEAPRGAIADAQVIATMAPDRQTFRAATDSAGRYEMIITPATGDYLLYIASPGRVSFRRRITTGPRDTVFVVDAALTKAVQTLATVRTVARRPAPPREDLAASEVGNESAERTTLAGALAPDQMGSLNALAALVPGVTIGADGALSFGGVDASQNRVTLNGTEFDGGAVPRGMYAQTRIASSVYDPSFGGFAGGNIAATLASGTFLTSALGNFTIDAPPLQGRDASSGQLGHQFTRFNGSYARTGELVPDLWVYNVGIQGTRQTSTAPSILGVDAATLNSLSLSGDSAAAFVRSLAASGIPVRAGGIPNDVTTNSVNLAFRLDRAAATVYGGVSRTDMRPRIGIIGSAIVSSSDPTFASAFAPPSHDSHSSSGHFMLQLNGSRYFGDSSAFLDEFRSAVSYNVNRSTPYLDLPGGSVLASSILADGSLGVAPLQFGGGASPSTSQSWRWETLNDVTYNVRNAPNHRLKFHAQTELQGYSSTGYDNALGTFGYSTLADLEANTPSSYSRTLYAPDRAGGELSGAFAVGDFWSPNADLQIVYGPRVDWTTFTRAPAYNADVDRVFGVRTDESPALVDVSPRIGFNWVYRGARKTRAYGLVSSALGSQYAPPAGVLRGGIGEFRASPQSTLLSSAIANTGLPGTSVRDIACAGSAVPAPDWSGYVNGAAAVPAACATGGDTQLFTDAAPPVQLFDRSYSAPRTWRGNLFWGSAYKILRYTIEGTFNVSADQLGRTDLNFGGAPKFFLSNEANRPVFVDATSVVPSTGVISPLAARQSSEFGQVLSYNSDRRTETKQITFGLQPILPFTGNVPDWMVGAWYTYSDGRSLDRGFDANTFGDPRSLLWASGSLPHHSIRAQVAYFIPHTQFVVSAYVMFQSGLSYTPLVAQDINGDGVANDRAFVFDPAHAPTPAISTAMSSLLASAPSDVRACLSRQLGAPAGRNSCQLPWTAPQSNFRVDWLKRFGTTQNVRFSLNVYNPLAGIDQMVNGAAHLHGWGSMTGADPRLLYVTGFDANARQFQYQVNPKFGTTRPNAVALYNPFRVSLDMSFYLTPNAQLQMARYYTRPVRSAPGVAPPADSILARIRNAGAASPSPYFWIIANSDSLLLSAEQVRTLVAAQARYRVWFDSTARASVAKLAALPRDADIKTINDLVHRAQFSGDEMQQEYALIKSVLTPVQRRLLPRNIARDIESAKP